MSYSPWGGKESDMTDFTFKGRIKDKVIKELPWWSSG